MSKEKAFTWGGVVLLILFVAFRPVSAAQVFRVIGGGIVSVATGFGDFITHLVSNETGLFEAIPCPANPGLGVKGFKAEIRECHSFSSTRHRTSSGSYGPEQTYKLQPTRSVPRPKVKKIKKAKVHAYGVIGPVKAILADQAKRQGASSCGGTEPSPTTPHLTLPNQATPHAHHT